MSSIVLFLLLSQTAPPQDYIGKLPNFPLHQHRQTMVKGRQAAYCFGNCGCFSIRSYVFARHDGNAPVLVGTSTCTPASTLRMEQTLYHPSELILRAAPSGENPR